MLRSSLALVALALSAPFACGAYTAVRLAPSSFNQDMIVDYGAPTALGSITATMDNGTTISTTTNTLSGGVWYERGYKTDQPATGVPEGLIAGQTDPTSTFYIEAARSDQTLNNTRLLDASSRTGTLTFLVPRAANSLAFATSTGNGTGAVTVTLHFANGAPDATGLTFTSPDWFFASDPRVVTPMGRIQNAATGSFDTQTAISDNPRIYEEVVAVPAAHAGDPISSIDLSWTSTGNNAHTAVFGVSSVPEPASLGLIGMSVVGLFVRRRK